MAIETEAYQIEVFEDVTESPDAEMPDKASFIARAEELGLKGQVALVEVEHTGERLIPFHRMQSDEYNLWASFAPRHVAVEEYKGGIMPERVMNLLERARECEAFHKVEVWSTEDAALDPLLVGHAGKNTYGGTEAFYLICRWGKELLTMAEVMLHSRARWIRERKRACESSISSDQAKLATLESDADRHFAGAHIW